MCTHIHGPTVLLYLYLYTCTGCPWFWLYLFLALSVVRSLSEGESFAVSHLSVSLHTVVVHSVIPTSGMYIHSGRLWCMYTGTEVYIHLKWGVYTPEPGCIYTLTGVYVHQNRCAHQIFPAVPLSALLSTLSNISFFFFVSFFLLFIFFWRNDSYFSPPRIFRCFFLCVFLPFCVSVCLSTENPLEDWPKDIIFFVRVASLLHGLCVQLSVHLPFLQIMVRRAQECLVQRYTPPSPLVYTQLLGKPYKQPNSYVVFVEIWASYSAKRKRGGWSIEAERGRKREGEKRIWEKEINVCRHVCI